MYMEMKTKFHTSDGQVPKALELVGPRMSSQSAGAQVFLASTLAGVLSWTMLTVCLASIGRR